MAVIMRFAVEDFAEELEAAPGNFQVGTRLLFENDAVRVWELRLSPGERLPFHCHRTTYYWACVVGGRAIQRFPDGTMHHVEFDVGDVDFLDEARLVREGIHDLENTGDTVCRFTTVEILG